MTTLTTPHIMKQRHHRRLFKRRQSPSPPPPPSSQHCRHRRRRLKFSGRYHNRINPQPGDYNYIGPLTKAMQAQTNMFVKLDRHEYPTVGDLEAIAEALTCDIQSTVITLAGLFVSRDRETLQKWSNYNKTDIDRYVHYLRWNGIWRTTGMVITWFDNRKYGDLPIVLDSLVASGNARRYYFGDENEPRYMKTSATSYGGSGDGYLGAPALTTNSKKKEHNHWSLTSVVRALMQQHSFTFEASLIIAKRGWHNDQRPITSRTQYQILSWVKREKKQQLPQIPQWLATAWKHYHEDHVKDFGLTYL